VLECGLGSLVLPGRASRDPVRRGSCVLGHLQAVRHLVAGKRRLGGWSRRAQDLVLHTPQVPAGRQGVTPVSTGYRSLRRHGAPDPERFTTSVSVVTIPRLDEPRLTVRPADSGGLIAAPERENHGAWHGRSVRRVATPAQLVRRLGHGEPGRRAGPGSLAPQSWHVGRGRLRDSYLKTWRRLPRVREVSRARVSRGRRWQTVPLLPALITRSS